MARLLLVVGERHLPQPEQRPDRRRRRRGVALGVRGLRAGLEHLRTDTQTHGGDVNLAHSGVIASVAERGLVKDPAEKGEVKVVTQGKGIISGSLVISAACVRQSPRLDEEVRCRVLTQVVLVLESPWIGKIRASRNGDSAESADQVLVRWAETFVNAGWGRI